MLFDQNRVDAIIHNWKNQVFSNETIQGVPQRHSTCLKPPIGGFRNLASSFPKSATVSQGQMTNTNVVKIKFFLNFLRPKYGVENKFFLFALSHLPHRKIGKDKIRRVHRL